jgi:hypothetical protein
MQRLNISARSINRLFMAILIIGAVALLWRAIFELNNWLFSNFALSERIHWIFLPAAFRIIAVLIWGARGCAGLMLGAYLTFPRTGTDDLLYEILLSVSSGLAPLLAVLACRRFFTIRNDLANLNLWHVIALSVSCAITNALLINLLLAVLGKQQPNILAIKAIFVGDVMGAALVLGTIAIAVEIVLRWVRRRRGG